MRLLSLLLAALLLAKPVLARSDPEQIDLVPAEQADWGPSNLLIGLTALLGAWSYWYGERVVSLQTVPADASVRLYYIRSNFQKRFERGATPLRFRLPQRANTTRKDYVTLKVSANGFSTAERTYNVRKIESELVIELSPLPNSLVSLASTHISGRTTLTLLTTEEPVFRISESREAPGFLLSLVKTAARLPDPFDASGGRVEAIDVEQVGEDILIRVRTREGASEVRSKQRYDPVREEFRFVLELTPEGARAPSPAEIRRSIERVRFGPGDRCHMSFETALRGQLGDGSGSGTYRLGGGLVELYRRELMLRLGRFARGTVRTVQGDPLRTGNPVELELALQSALGVRGFVALCAAFARLDEEPELVLRSLLAPGMPRDEFHRAYAAGRRAWRACAN